MQYSGLLSDHESRSLQREAGDYAGSYPDGPSRSGGRGHSVHASRHQAAEQRRRSRINERLELLRKLVPHAEKANTASFLEEVIKCVHSLNSRVAELEAQVKEQGLFVGTRNTPPRQQLQQQQQQQQQLQQQLHQQQQQQGQLQQQRRQQELQHASLSKAEQEQQLLSQLSNNPTFQKMLQMQLLGISAPPLNSNNQGLLRQYHDTQLVQHDPDLANPLLRQTAVFQPSSSPMSFSFSMPHGNVLSMGVTLQQLQQSQFGIPRGGDLPPAQAASRSPSRLTDLAAQLGISSQSLNHPTTQPMGIQTSDALSPGHPSGASASRKNQSGLAPWVLGPNQSPASSMPSHSNMPFWRGASGSQSIGHLDVSVSQASMDAPGTSGFNKAIERTADTDPTALSDLCEPSSKKRRSLVL